MREVHFFYDIVCPFAYLGSTAIGGICEAAGARLRLRPMLLGGVYRAIGQADYPRVPAPRVRGNAIDLDRWARQRGVTLRFPFGHPRRTVETMRLLTACAMDCEGGDEAPLSALTQALYRAYWVDGDDLADRAVLARLAQAHGLSIDRIDDEAVKQRLRRTTDEAVAEGAFGAPTVVIVDERGERRMYFGQDRLHFVAEALGLPRAAPPPPQVPPAGRELVFLFDFASPYTYLAATQVERVARERGARVTWQPVFIGGLFKQIGNPIVPILETTEARRRYLGRDLLDWAGYWGVPFRWPSRFPLSTLTALRMTLAAEAAAVPRLALALFAAAWADDRDLGDPAVLREVADGVGCDGAALLARAGEADIKARLGEHTAAAVAAGAWGLPSFLVGDELFFGQDRLEQVAAALSG